MVIVSEEKSKVTKAQQKAVKKYVNAHYDRIEITAPKGFRQKVQDHAAAVGESVNKYIQKAIDTRMDAEDDPGPHNGQSE